MSDILYSVEILSASGKWMFHAAGGEREINSIARELQSRGHETRIQKCRSVYSCNAEPRFVVG
jgi:hypothetical protein